jgi:hypothetical protein
LLLLIGVWRDEQLDDLGSRSGGHRSGFQYHEDGRTFDGAADPSLMTDPIEKHLWNTIQSTVADANLHIAREDFEAATESLSTLRSAVDAFFDKIKVNDMYEACGEGFAEPTEYVRRILPIVSAGSAASEAWTYLYNWPVDGLPRIASGRFLEK